MIRNNTEITVGIFKAKIIWLFVRYIPNAYCILCLCQPSKYIKHILLKQLTR